MAHNNFSAAVSQQQQSSFAPEQRFRAAIIKRGFSKKN
jgi:hypothetical protein